MRPLGLGAPQMVRRYLDVSEGIFFDTELALFATVGSHRFLMQEKSKIRD